MEMTPFAVEYRTNAPEFTGDLRDKIETRLQKLAKGKQGIDRAVVNVQNHNGASTPHEYRVRIMVYDHALNAEAIETDSSISAAVTKALSVVERQMRESRDRRRSLRRRQAKNYK